MIPPEPLHFSPPGSRRAGRGLRVLSSCLGPGFQEPRQGDQRHGGAGTPDRRRGPPPQELGGDQDDESSQGLPGRDAPGLGELRTGEDACLWLPSSWSAVWCFGSSSYSRNFLLYDGVYLWGPGEVVVAAGAARVAVVAVIAGIVFSLP